MEHKYRTEAVAEDITIYTTIDADQGDLVAAIGFEIIPRPGSV